MYVVIFCKCVQLCRHLCFLRIHLITVCNVKHRCVRYYTLGRWGGGGVTCTCWTVCVCNCNSNCEKSVIGVTLITQICNRLKCTHDSWLASVSVHGECANTHAMSHGSICHQAHLFRQKESCYESNMLPNTRNRCSVLISWMMMVRRAVVWACPY